MITTKKALFTASYFQFRKCALVNSTKTWKHTCAHLGRNCKGKCWYHNGKEEDWQRSWSREVVIRNLSIYSGRRVLVDSERRGLAALNTWGWWAFFLEQAAVVAVVVVVVVVVHCYCSIWIIVWKRWGWQWSSIWRIARERWGCQGGALHRYWQMVQFIQAIGEGMTSLETFLDAT